MRFRDIDWKNWQARDPATLVFVIVGNSMLLIEKKRGLGAGKINAPGGRLEPFEPPIDGAVRETEEELLITPSGLTHAGENRFQFVDGYSIHVHVFRASGYSGVPTETAEAKPLWVPIDDIPFEAMWEDDRLWVPLVVRGTRFSGRYLFDGDAMLGHELDVLEPGAKPPKSRPGTKRSHFASIPRK